jgi:hypothetical protein
MSKPPLPVAWFGWLIVGWVVLGCVTLLLELTARSHRHDLPLLAREHFLDIGNGGIRHFLHFG